MSSNQKGFTLIEFIMVMVLLGILVAAGAKFVMGRTTISAEESMLKTVVAHLNDYEIEAWMNLKSEMTWTSDDQVFDLLDVSGYKWQNLNQDGGVVFIRDKPFPLKRNRSTQYNFGSWEVP